MLTAKKLLVPVLCVLLGCVGGAALGPAAAQMHAFPATPHARWEQMCEVPAISALRQSRIVDGYNEHLANRGAQGWEMVSFVMVRGDYMICFKRPAP